MRALLRAPTRPVTRSFLFETGSDQPTPPKAPLLAAPASLFSAEQSAFEVTTHVDGRGNWEVQNGRLVCTGNNPAQAARLAIDTALTPGDYHFFKSDLELTAGQIKFQLASPGATAANNALGDWQGFQNIPVSEATGAFTEVRANPNASFVGSISDLELFNLSATDPTKVACDVVIIGGDSNVSNAASELVTNDNRETEFDGRVWYMPGLRIGGTYNDAQAFRHVPRPAEEPIVSMASAKRMSPCHAIATELVEYSAARGRPLLIMALGEAGSGMSGSKGLWQKNAVPNNNAPRMWDEMTAMKAAVDDLGPDHQIIGAVWSIGANDRTGADYDNTDLATLYPQFFADVRELVADVPMVLINLGDHTASGALEDVDQRSERMRVWLREFDQDSGTIKSIDRFRVVEPPQGNPLYPDSGDPHFNAAGMQANGRVAGQALLGMLPSSALAATAPPTF